MAKPTKGKDSPQGRAVERLHAVCGLGDAKCRKALQANGGDVELALAAVIDAGDVKPDDLDPDLVSDELFGRARHRSIGGVYHMPSKSAQPFAGAVTGEDVARVVAEQKRKLDEQGKDFKESGVHARASARISRRYNALKKKPVVVHLPPLPKLTLKLSEWEGHGKLKPWRALARRDRPAGTFSVAIPRAENDADANPTPPTPEMVAAYAHLAENGAEVAAAVFEAFRSSLNAIIGKHDVGMKPVKKAEQLGGMIELDAVNPHGVAKNGLAYLGLHFSCTWDEEHGAGVLLHGSRVAKVGEGDAAGDTFAAIEDGGKEIAGWDRGPAESMKRPPNVPWLP